MRQWIKDLAEVLCRPFVFVWQAYLTSTLNQPENMPVEPSTSTATASQPPEVIVPTLPQPEPIQSHLDVFCTALMNFEGGPTDPNHVNKNPGDFRCSTVGYLPKYGKVGCTPAGFAVFPTFAQGWEYLEESVHYRAAAHPTWTFLDFFENYAPASDENNPVHYAETVAAACGVDKSTILSTYLG